ELPAAWRGPIRLPAGGELREAVAWKLKLTAPMRAPEAEIQVVSVASGKMEPLALSAPFPLANEGARVPGPSAAVTAARRWSAGRPRAITGVVPSAGEFVVLLGLILALYTALRPLRRWLERRIARLLRRDTRRGHLTVVLKQRRDGKFEREESHDG